MRPGVVAGPSWPRWAPARPPGPVDFLERAHRCVNHRRAVLHTTRDPSLAPTTPARAEPPRIFLLCPETLAPKARCVEDALRARGLRVTLALGRRARRWVRQVPPGSPSLRVLCVADIDPTLAERLAQGRDDFHVLVLDTPSRVVAELERLTGRARSRRKPRPSRMYLAQPTLVEQQLVASRSFGWGAAATAVLLAVGAVGGAMLGGISEPPSPAHEPAVTVRVPSEAAVPPRRAHDEPVLSAMKPVDPEALAVDDEAATAIRPRR
jgi:hypothetical protein